MPATPDKRYFKLFACCLPVKGAARSVVCDIQRTDLQPIPNDLYDILIAYKNQSIDAIKADYHVDTHPDIDDYFSFLEENEYGFWCNNPEQFPELDLHWESPHAIESAIIDSNRTSLHNYGQLINQLSDLGCIALQLRFYDPVAIKLLTDIVATAEGSRLHGIEIVAPYTSEMTEEAITLFTDTNPIISIFTIHSAPLNKKTTTQANIVIHYTDQIINNHTHCGIIDASYFYVNIENFTEAQKFNTCLNKKLSVDVDGAIKNCPSLSSSYGNAAEKPLTEAIQSQEFTKLWGINKDQITVCKDCEFRYICTDCRAYTQNNGLYEKPQKCNYNPYTAEWEKAE